MNRRSLWLVMMIGGVLAALVGGGLLALTLLVGLLSDGSLGQDTTLPAASMAAVAFVLGGAAVYHGWAGWRGRPSRPFPPKSARWWWLALGAAVAAGAVVVRLQALPALLLPPLHVVAMALPPLILVALTASVLRPRRESWRTMIAGLAGGGLVGMPLTVLAEGALVIAVGLLIGAAFMASAGGPERIADLLEQLQDPAMLGDPRRMMELVLNPVIVVGVAGVAGFAVPLIEEVLKTLAVGIGSAFTRPDPARAFVWGVAGGAGFAIVENLFSGNLSGQTGWAAIAMSRMAASTLHCFTGGLVGWGWGQVWARGQVRRFVASFAGASILHGLWNLVAVGVALAPAFAASRGNQGVWAIVATVAPVAGLLLLVGVGLGLTIALPLVARHLAAQRVPLPEENGAGG
jgi:hypothetical protein